MSLLARAKIITKILAVILLLAAVAVSISWLGIAAMGVQSAVVTFGEVTIDFQAHAVSRAGAPVEMTASRILRSVCWK